MAAVLHLAACGREGRAPGEPDRTGAVPASWAKVAPEQIEAAKKAGVPVAFENSIGMRFVLVPAGTFTMGSPATEPRRNGDETQHEVTLTKPYYLGITEVTNGQYRRFRADHDSGAGPSEGLSFDGDDQPVVNVSWDDATEFVVWHNARDRGRTYPMGREPQPQVYYRMTDASRADGRMPAIRIGSREETPR